eukprot:767326-Hanusia_phi.AAC.1
MAKEGKEGKERGEEAEEENKNEEEEQGREVGGRRRRNWVGVMGEELAMITVVKKFGESLTGFHL